MHFDHFGSKIIYIYTPIKFTNTTRTYVKSSIFFKLDEKSIIWRIYIYTVAATHIKGSLYLQISYVKPHRQNRLHFSIPNHQKWVPQLLFWLIIASNPSPSKFHRRFPLKSHLRTHVAQTLLW